MPVIGNAPVINDVYTALIALDCPTIRLISVNTTLLLFTFQFHILKKIPDRTCIFNGVMLVLFRGQISLLFRAMLMKCLLHMYMFVRSDCWLFQLTALMQ